MTINLVGSGYTCYLNQLRECAHCMLGQGNEAHGDVSLSDEDDGLLADDAQVTTSAPPVPSLLAQFLLRLDQDERIAQQEAERQTEAAQQQAEQAIREFETALRAMRYRETLPENLKKGARELWIQTFGASPPFRSIPQGNPTEGPYHWPVSEETLSEVIEEKRQEIFGKVAADRAAADAKREAVKQRGLQAYAKLAKKHDKELAYEQTAAPKDTEVHPYEQALSATKPPATGAESESKATPTPDVESVEKVEEPVEEPVTGGLPREITFGNKLSVDIPAWRRVRQKEIGAGLAKRFANKALDFTNEALEADPTSTVKRRKLIEAREDLEVAHERVNRELLDDGVEGTSKKLANRRNSLDVNVDLKGTAWNRLHVLKEQCVSCFSIVREERDAWQAVGDVIGQYYDRKRGALKLTKKVADLERDLIATFRQCRAPPASWWITEVVTKLQPGKAKKVAEPVADRTSRPEKDAILEQPETSRSEERVKLNNVVLERPKRRRPDDAALDRPKECTSRPEERVKLNNVVLERPKKHRPDDAVLDRPKGCTQFEI